MTKFDKTLFRKDGDYLFYGNEFVARFKRLKSDRPGFISFLVKNISVEEYFEEMKTSAPLPILEKRGYIGAFLKKNLKAMGYEPTVEGKNKYIADQVAKYYKGAQK